MKLYSKVKYKIVVAFIRDISRWERQNDEEREKHENSMPKKMCSTGNEKKPVFSVAILFQFR